MSRYQSRKKSTKPANRARQQHRYQLRNFILPRYWKPSYLQALNITINQLPPGSLLPGISSLSTLPLPLRDALLGIYSTATRVFPLPYIVFSSAEILSDQSYAADLFDEVFNYFYPSSLGTSRTTVRFGPIATGWKPHILLPPFLAGIIAKKRSGLAEDCGTLAALAQIGNADRVWVVTLREYKVRICTAAVNPEWVKWVEGGGGVVKPAGMDVVTKTWDLRIGKERLGFVSELQAILVTYGGLELQQD
ncbi:hypothetical protein EDC01DRAFT_630402 [Geopyxis carbonaria]|nr:hypothetical protein EDC01DRAFT_630402 [Geopyxis carbonaria]